MGTGSESRWSGRSLLIAGVLIAVLLAVAFIDYGATEDKLPAFVPGTNASDPIGLERQELAHDYGVRAWLYMGAALLVVAGLLAYNLCRNPPGRRHELFVDLGVAGVVALVIGAICSGNQPDVIENSNNGTIFFMPAICMLAVAAIGGGFYRLQGAARRERPEVAGSSEARPDTGAKVLSRTAIGLSALTVVLIIVGLEGNECGSNSGWQDDLLLFACFVGLAGAAVGIAALVMRRWVAALLSLPAPLVAFVALLTSACLS